MPNIAGTDIENQQALLKTLQSFDEKCNKNTIYALNISDDMIQHVKILKDEDVPDWDKFFRVPYTDVAGLNTWDSETSPAIDNLYVRDEVRTIWQEMDNLSYKNNLVIQGQPGTGKSIAVWRKVLEMALAGDTILWISLKQNGGIESAVYFQKRCFYEFKFRAQDIENFLNCTRNVPLDTVVLDGRSQKSTDLMETVDDWVKLPNTSPKSRSISTASVKVEQKRSHQNDTYTYLIVHSWTIDEFNNALVQEETPTALYYACADLFSEDYGIKALNLEENEDLSDQKCSDSSDLDEIGNTKNSKKMGPIPVSDIFAIISSRYKFSGGSARWMFNYTKEKMDSMLNDYCNSLDNLTAIQNGDMGPTSEVSKNYFFGSSRKANGKTEYFLVSKRAVEILVKKSAGAVYNSLYNFADSLENPSFTDWVVDTVARSRKVRDHK